jgi:NADH-quinone oxidoreductase subunit N
MDDIIILKSFIPEIFLSFSILLQLVLNVRFINSVQFNFPIIDFELFYQTFFILFCLTFLYFNLKIEGVFLNFLFLNDESTKIAKIIIIFFSLLTLVIIFKSFSIQNLNFFEFFIIFLLSLLSLLLIVSACDFISFYLLIEMQTLCFYILSTFKRSSAFSTEAGLKYFISGSFISGFFLFGVSLLYGCLGTLNINNINLLLSFPINSIDIDISLRYIIDTSIIFILVTLLFKIGCAPFHFWAPDVYEGSPLSSTIIFSIIPKISVFYFFVKVICSLNFFFIDLQDILLCFGLFSTVLGTFFALSQTRLKRLIIYSSIAQIGFLVVSLSINSLQSFTSMYFFLFIYLITSVLIWGHITAFYFFQAKIYLFYSRLSTSLFLSSLSNFFQLNNLWSFSFLIILFSIAGIPPLTGFLGKMMILLELIHTNFFISSIILIFISSISVFYYIKLIKLMFFEQKISNLNIEHFQIISSDLSMNLLYSVFIICLLFLILIFFSPSGLYFLCHFLVLASTGC